MPADYSTLMSALIDEFKKRKTKNEKYSLRALARDLGVSKTTLSEVLRGQREISPDVALKITRHLEGDFEGLGLENVQSTKRRSPHISVLTPEEFEEISDWYNFAILSLVENSKFEATVSSLSQSLELSEELVKNSIEKLESLKLIRHRAGSYERGKSFVISSSENREFQNNRLQTQVFELSEKAFSAHGKNAFFENKFLALDENSKKQLVTQLNTFMERLSKKAKQNASSDVKPHVLSLQLFPLK